MRDSRSNEGGQLLSQLQRERPQILAEAKAALRTLVEVYNRIDILMAKKFGAHAQQYWSLSADRSGKEDVEQEIRKLSEGLATLVKVAKRRQDSLVNVREMAKRFEESNSLEEISTLIGLTLLADYKGHASGLDLITDLCENKIYPNIPILADLMQFALELDSVCKWTHEILDRDISKGEDEIIRMITAIKKLDLDEFNRIYGRLDQRLKIEESQ